MDMNTWLEVGPGHWRVRLRIRRDGLQQNWPAGHVGGHLQSAGTDSVAGRPLALDITETSTGQVRGAVELVSCAPRVTSPRWTTSESDCHSAAPASECTLESWAPVKQAFSHRMNCPSVPDLSAPRLRPCLDCKFLQSGHCSTFCLYLTNFVRSWTN